MDDKQKVAKREYELAWRKLSALQDERDAVQREWEDSLWVAQEDLEARKKTLEELGIEPYKVVDIVSGAKV